MSARLFAFCLLAATLLSVGCSNDRHVFHSTVGQPTTIHLVDSHSGNVLWTKPIPAQHRLELDMDRKDENETMSVKGKPATRVHWKLYEDGKGEFIEREIMDLPGTPLFIDVEYRPGPEYPDGKPPEPIVSHPKKPGEAARR